MLIATRLTEQADRLVGELSHGDQRVGGDRHGAGAASPRLLLLDEPTAGMGEQETYQVAGLIRRLHRHTGYTIVLIEHDMRVVFNLADRIMVLDQGTVAGRGNAGRDRRRSGGAGRLSGKCRGMNALEAEGLNTYYGKSHILHDVGLTVPEGQITTLLGRNGAGKTTTLRSLVGPDAGAQRARRRCSARRQRGCRRFVSRRSGWGMCRKGGDFSQPDGGGGQYPGCR